MGFMVEMDLSTHTSREKATAFESEKSSSLYFEFILTNSRIFTKNLGPIGSAVLTFIGYKQTNRQTDKPNLYIDTIQIAAIVS